MQYDTDGWRAWEVRTEKDLAVIVVTHDDWELPAE